MHLEKLVPRKFLRYRWVTPVKTVGPFPIPPKPLSTQGVDVLDGIPNGAAVAAGGGAAPDALRGTLYIYFPWMAFQGTGLLTTLYINVYKNTDTVDPLYAVTMPNALAGRTSILVAPGDPVLNVALDIQTAISAWFGMLGLFNKYRAEGGDIVLQPTISPTQVVIIAPKTHQASSIVGVTDAMAPMIALESSINPYLVPFFYAGFHPGPWVITGEPFDGYIPPFRGEGGPALSPVPLLSAGNFEVLAKSAITNVPTSVITGMMGVSPAAASTITGFALTLDGGGQFSTSAQVSGPILAADYAPTTPAALTQAVLDMQAAYTDAAGRVPDVTGLSAGILNGITITPGVYKWTTGVSITGDITLAGDASSVFIFQISGVLSLAAAKNIILSGGVLPTNVFWQVAGNTAIGTGAHFRGVILDATDITLGAGALLTGKALAQTAVNFNSDTLN